MDYITALFGPIWLMLPALVPNSAAVLFGGGTPMDFGRTWKGRRILGDGKTWRGFFGGALTGVIVGLIELIISRPFSDDHYGFGEIEIALPVIFALAFGSLLGDTGGAFIKRRLGMRVGQKAPGLDQYDFIIGAFILAIIINYNWFYDNMIAEGSLLGLILLLILIPLIHRGVNIIGYKMGKKDVPW